MDQPFLVMKQKASVRAAPQRKKTQMGALAVEAATIAETAVDATAQEKGRI